MRLNFNFGFGEKKHGGGGAPPANPNLLRWTEEFDNAAWVKESVAVIPDTDTGALGGQTADTMAFTAGGDFYQLSQTSATTGATVGAGAVLTGALTRFSVTGTFDSLPYTFSIYLNGPAGLSLVLNILRSGGFLRCQVTDVDENGPTIIADGAKLEQSASPSAYNHRTN